MSDIFRKEPREISHETHEVIISIKKTAEALLDMLERHNPEQQDKRYTSLAKTNLEQAVMWAVKAIT